MTKRLGTDAAPVSGPDASEPELAQDAPAEADLVRRGLESAAHDFNNLLTVIRMSLIALAEPGLPPDEVRDVLRDAANATERGVALTRDLFTFARMLRQMLEVRGTRAGPDV